MSNAEVLAFVTYKAYCDVMAKDAAVQSKDWKDLTPTERKAWSAAAERAIALMKF